MTWFWVSAGKHGTHHGVLDDATVRADCGTNFPASGTLRLDLAPGEKPSDPEQICSECRIVWDSSDARCPHCGAGVQPQPAPPKVAAWSCAECGLDFAATVVNPELASIVSLLRTTVFLAVLRTEVFGAVARRAEHDSRVDVTLPPQTPADRRLSFATTALLATGRFPHRRP